MELCNITCSVWFYDYENELLSHDNETIFSWSRVNRLKKHSSDHGHSRLPYSFYDWTACASKNIFTLQKPAHFTRVSSVKENVLPSSKCFHFLKNALTYKNVKECLNSDVLTFQKNAHFVKMTSLGKNVLTFKKMSSYFKSSQKCLSCFCHYLPLFACVFGS